MLLQILLTLLVPIIYTENEFPGVRPTVVSIGTDWNSEVWAFYASGGLLYWTDIKRRDDIRDTTKWVKLDLPSGLSTCSNPKALFTIQNEVLLFIHADDGQVYYTFFNQSLSKLKWINVNSDLPFDEGILCGAGDTISVFSVGNKLQIFARSITNTSYLYTSIISGEKASLWQMIGQPAIKLLKDAAIGWNSFTQMFEAFIVANDGYLYRSWQLSMYRWSSWDKTGYYAPSSQFAPVVYGMSTNMFNGQLNLFVHGEDNMLYHIWQTTCDKVPNPWGWCTWSTWKQIGSKMPQSANLNTLSIGNNLHLGIEIFLSGLDGNLYKLWQKDRGGIWNGWQLVDAQKEYKLASLPQIIDDGSGWWCAYALDAQQNLIAIKQNRSLTLSTDTIISGSSFTISWDMPEDEVTSNDWIGIFLSNTSNQLYLDYVYVGGGQNPSSKAVSHGNINVTTYLPDGAYDVRYLIDKRFVAALDVSTLVKEGSEDVAWIQIFSGIFTGLQFKNVNVSTCVRDAEDIETDFLDAFEDFEEKSIYSGLQKLGVAVNVIVKAMSDCGISQNIINRISTFVKDLIACTDKGSCVHFVVDISTEILVLYENSYEIYGDIRASINSFNIKAYEQGGVNIGRIIKACIDLPR
ncbi:uncharacterized protein LOC100213807 isoform X3 [Hydra vulgaris]|uniref:Uncharacterized protein LOC100213807 isoform X3 n=1 Tax=Hydra vulgaris TaxID=6087 RepID=A0ABM4CJT5_HYDVU